MPDPLITVTGLALERGGRQLLAGFDLHISPGDLLLIEGYNGSGKTTLLRTLAGLSSLGRSGRVEHHCESLLYIGHRPGIKQLLTPQENLGWACHSQGWDPAGIPSALQQVGLAGYEDVQCHSLSAGQQRRVNLARMYLSAAAGAAGAVWLLDEPFTAIDRGGVAALTHTIAGQVAGGGAVILTSHQDLPFELPLRRVRLGIASGEAA